MKQIPLMFQGIRRLSWLAMLASLLFISINLKAQIPGCNNPCNLVTNGNFSAGNTGFTSDLPFQCGACAPGHYCIGLTFSAECSSWPTAAEPNGNFLIIDGDASNSNKDVWKSKVPTCLGVIYTFSCKVKNIFSTTAHPDALFDIGMMINGVNHRPGATVNSSWTSYSCTFVGTGSPVNIAIRQLTSGAKRDFGIDDIVFSFCPQIKRCNCPPGWLANETNIDGGVTTDGKCKKQLCVWDPTLYPPPSPTGTAIGTWGFLWGNGLYVWGTDANHGKAICTETCPCPQ